MGRKMPSPLSAWEVNGTSGPFKVRHQDVAQQIHDLKPKVEIRLRSQCLESVAAMESTETHQPWGS